MNNNIAFVFTHGPHGDSSGREGVDALLSISAFVENLGVFFISDGILLLLDHQQPELILARNFIKTLKSLPVYDIKKLYICAESVSTRGLTINNKWILNVNWLSTKLWRQYLDDFTLILTF